MNIRTKAILSAVLAVILTSLVTIRAHNGAYEVASFGALAAPAIVIDGVGTAGVGEWAGASPANVRHIDYGLGGDLKGHVFSLHKADGIYLLINIEDANTELAGDTLVILFDLDHSGGTTVDADDFGIEVRRDNTVKWGPANVSRSLWTATTNAHAGNPSLPTWTVEAHLPAGPLPCSTPCTLDLNANGGKIGIYFQIFDAHDAFGAPSAVYTQWPLPSNVNVLSDTVPNDWGNYKFDPATTFPDISLNDVRRGDAGVASYYVISHTANNRFDVIVDNPGSTVVPNAIDVRLNLYLAAIGIGEPWHRLDRESTINFDCASTAPWPSTSFIAKSSVCNGANARPDVSDPSVSLTDLVNNTAIYTIKDGVDRVPTAAPVNPTVSVPPGTTPFQVVTWNTTAPQDPRFDDITVGGTTYQRGHQCMLAQAIYPNDPNPGNNLVAENMNFESVAGGSASGGAAQFAWGMGNAGFGQYNPAVGKDMFLQVVMKNMDRQAGWDFKLEGVRAMPGENVFVAHLVGKESQQGRLALKAPAAETMGRTIKENLMVPPKAGGFQVNAKLPSGEAPVYVKVNGGSTLQIANYAFTANDEQNVDLDGKGKLLPPNGPGGLPASVLQTGIQNAGEKFRLLLANNAPLGAMVGSWDNFQTAFLIGDGVQVKVPANAKFLALGINDGLGFYADNGGTGFRVKIVEPAIPAPRPAASPSATNPMQKIAFKSAQLASAATPDIIPINEVMPTLCIKGYEDIGEKRSLGGTPHELFRYIGKVCWGIINVHPPNRSEKPDQGDAFDGPQVPRPKRCGSARGVNFALASFVTFIGILVIRLRVSRRGKSKR